MFIKRFMWRPRPSITQFQIVIKLVQKYFIKHTGKSKFFLIQFFTAVIYTSVSLVSLRKYLFKLVKGTILQLFLEHAVHTFSAMNLKQKTPVGKHEFCENRLTESHITYRRKLISIRPLHISWPISVKFAVDLSVTLLSNCEFRGNPKRTACTACFNAQQYTG